MVIDKDTYVKIGEALVEEDGFSIEDLKNLKAFVQSTAGQKLIGTLSIEAKNNIMRMANIDFSTPTAPIEAQSLRGGALALNSFIDTLFGLIEEPEEEIEA